MGIDKVREWNEIRKELAEEFHKAGLYEVCELQFSMCIGRALPLQFAHSKKRIDWSMEPEQRLLDAREVVRSCTACHNYIEHLPDTADKSGHERMYEIVTATIKKREKRLKRWKKIS